MGAPLKSSKKFYKAGAGYRKEIEQIKTKLVALQAKAKTEREKLDEFGRDDKASDSKIGNQREVLAKVAMKEGEFRGGKAEQALESVKWEMKALKKMRRDLEKTVYPKKEGEMDDDDDESDREMGRGGRGRMASPPGYGGGGMYGDR